MKKVLVTGAGGYIGSIATYLLLKNGYQVIAIDNLSRGYKQPLKKLQKQFGKDKLTFYFGDLQKIVDKIITKEKGISKVLHYAAFCNVGESEKDPFIYFNNNINGTLSLLEAMKKAKIKKIIFSSTCALYGEPQTDTISETHPVNPTSHPYGESKYISERIIDWYSKTYGIQYIFLRYFNVCGATDDGEFGDSKKPSFHLMQNAVRGALGIDSFLLNNTTVDTPDKTPIRDYVNVVDLNEAHLMALDYIDTIKENDIFNIGTGAGNSVLEVITAVEKITGVKLNLKAGERRKGDVSKAVATNTKIHKTLRWKPKRSLEDSVTSLVKWYTKYPQGWKN